MKETRLRPLHPQWPLRSSFEVPSTLNVELPSCKAASTPWYRTLPRKRRLAGYGLQRLFCSWCRDPGLAQNGKFEELTEEWENKFESLKLV
jgi:hypothetical protein